MNSTAGERKSQLLLAKGFHAGVLVRENILKAFEYEYEYDNKGLILCLML